MVAATKRKTSLTLDAEMLDLAKELGINVSAVAENATAFAAQSDWHERHGHPLADIITAPGGASWNT